MQDKKYIIMFNREKLLSDCNNWVTLANLLQVNHTVQVQVYFAAVAYCEVRIRKY